MAEARSLGTLRPISGGGNALKASAWFCFLVAVAGQWLFAYYMLVFYGGSTAKGDFKAWNSVLTHGVIKGDLFGNIAIVVHIFLAFVITVGGPLQFIPQIRTNAVNFHRWNGRVYLLTAVTAGIAGFYMIWIRGTVGDVVQHLGTSLGAVLIVICAAMTVRHAIARKFAVHRRWALRLFLVVSGGWFFRVGLMFWLILNKGPTGFDPNSFQGPFLSFLAFAEYLVPLAILELYLRTQNGADQLAKWSMAVALLGLTVALGIGIFGAAGSMWLPHILRTA